MQIVKLGMLVEENTHGLIGKFANLRVRQEHTVIQMRIARMETIAGMQTVKGYLEMSEFAWSCLI